MKQIANNYDLEERTAQFGESIMIFCKSLPSDQILLPLVNQLVRSATSIGANYMEANGASSKKESQETKHWLRMIAVCCADRKEEIRLLWKEAQELTLIFQKITSTLKDKSLKLD